MENQNTQVRFELPDYVRPTRDEFDGADVKIEYDSNFNGFNDTVTIAGEAEIQESQGINTSTRLVVDDRHIKSNGHVFSPNDRHLGPLKSITVTIDKQDGIEIVTTGVQADVDDHGNQIVIQTWDRSVIHEQGFIAGTDEVCMEIIQNTNPDKNPSL